MMPEVEKPSTPEQQRHYDEVMQRRAESARVMEEAVQRVRDYIRYGTAPTPKPRPRD